VGELKGAAFQREGAGVAQAVGMVGVGVVLQHECAAGIKGDAARSEQRAVRARQNQTSVVHRGRAAEDVRAAERPGAGVGLGELDRVQAVADRAEDHVAGAGSVEFQRLVGEVAGIDRRAPDDDVGFGRDQRGDFVWVAAEKVDRVDRERRGAAGHVQAVGDV